MIRRVLAMLAALLCAAGALAEAAPTAAVPDVEAIDFVEADAGFEGMWVPFEDGFRLYLPAAWRSFAIPDELAGAGLFYRAGGIATSGEANMGVAVGFMVTGDMEDMEDFTDNLLAQGFADVGEKTYNGMSAVAFASPDGSFRGAAFYHPTVPDYAILVYVTPVCATTDAILDSLSPRQDEAGSPAAAE